MKITLPQCAHSKVVTYAFVRLGRDMLLRGLCESCFVRLVKLQSKNRWSEDAPRGGDPCPHKHVDDLPSKLTDKKPYRNGVCRRCGAGLRAGNATQNWSPLREYRFIIEEHP